MFNPYEYQTQSTSSFSMFAGRRKMSQYHGAAKSSLYPQFKQICFLVSHKLPNFNNSLLSLCFRSDGVGSQGMTFYSIK